MSKEETLVELAVLEDPLCGAERYFLTVRPTADGFEYVESNTTCEDFHKLASSNTALNADQIADLLDSNLWLGCDVTLENLEDSQLAQPEEWVYGGKYPLLSCSSKEERICHRFYAWVKAYCEKILAERNQE
jgi:hypothetical protein